MLALHSHYDPGVLYDQIFASLDCSTIVIENKLLYGMRVTGQVPDGFVLEHSNELFPTTRIRPQAPPDVTILCYGGMLPDVEKAIERLFDEHEIICEVLCPTQLYPFNPWPVIESLQQSRRLLVIEEGIGFAAFGAEVLALVSEHGAGMEYDVSRVSSPRHPIPSCGPLEKVCLPGESHVVQAAVEMMSI